MRRLKQIIRLLNFISHKICFPCIFRGGNRNFFAPGIVDIHHGGSIELGADNWIESGYTLAAVGGAIKIGNHNYFNRNVKIVCYESIEIGNDCLFADLVHIYDQDHCFSDSQRLIREQGYITKAVKIGNNVWIGAKATIVKGVTIGDGAVIGANATVTRDVPPNAIVAGNPAVIVRMRQ